MKLKYDKKNSSHDIKVGDSVMLWWPYFKKNIPRSFQPKWKGPWLVTRLYDKTNCTISNDSGETKHVHLNQLKLIESRYIKNGDIKYINSNDKSEIEYTSFDDLYTDVNPENDFTNEPMQNELINYGWCNVDESNILPHCFPFPTKPSFSVFGDNPVIPIVIYLFIVTPSRI